MNRGHIRKRGPNSWAVIIRVKDPETGKSKPRWHTVKGDEEAAKSKLSELLYKVDHGLLGPPTSETVETYLRRW
ncbi:MAG: hypothetical protein C4575_13170 [Desulforudis sp.]|jgi:hypothetical protein|nr:MAG: hypothetical protein C4575_13170 [Desulforudis sp.]